MATISITIPDDKIEDVKSAFADAYGYQAEIEEIIDDEPTGNMIPNPETKAQFAKRQVAQYAKSIYVAWYIDQQVDSVRDTALATAKGIEIT